MKRNSHKYLERDVKFLTEKLICRLRKAGVLDETGLRNIRIKSEYLLSRKTLTQFEALNRVAEKFFLSPESIRDIVFKQRKKYMIN